MFHFVVIKRCNEGSVLVYNDVFIIRDISFQQAIINYRSVIDECFKLFTFAQFKHLGDSALNTF
jgi:hypothetical protein